MFKTIKKLASNSKASLFTFNNEPFSKFSILLIILLDIFLLTTIFTGISSEKNMAPEVYSKYPIQCQNHFNPKYKNKVWDSTTGRYLYNDDKFPFSSYSSFTINYDSGYYGSARVHVKDNNRVAAVCRELDSKISTFANTRIFKNNKKLLIKLKNDKRNVFSEINTIEGRYNTTLFEKTANGESPEISKMKNKYTSLLRKEKSIDAQIKGIKKVKEYKGYDEYVSFIKENRVAFKKEIKEYRFWQPFLSFLYLLKFTLPLMLLSFIGYKYTNRVNRKVSVPNKLIKLFSSHIIFISSIPIFFNGLYLIYHIIPHRFLKAVVETLYEFGAIFLGFYFLLFVGGLIFAFLIFFIQRNASKRAKIKAELLVKGRYVRAFNQSKCPRCENRVNYKAQKFCGFCATKLNRECTHCKEETPTHIRYCINCGEEGEKNE